MPEYYLPVCEREIIKSKAAEIGRILSASGKPIEVVELGAGDGTKTIELLKGISETSHLKAYHALDISANILEENRKNVATALPELSFYPVAGNYFQTFPLKRDNANTHLNLFLGSNIGNFDQEKTRAFFKWMHDTMNADDCLLVAFDLKKNPQVILSAYDDAAGITARFNMNLLVRMNRELGANFNLDNFAHYPIYNPDSGQAESYLISLEEQSVTFANGVVVQFDANEPIHTEISRKFSLSEIEDTAWQTGFKTQHFLDNRAYYSLTLFHK